MANDPNADYAAGKGSEGVPAPEGRANLIDTDYVIGQDNVTTRKWGVSVDLHGKVFSISSIVVVFFVLLTLALPDRASDAFEATRKTLTNNFDWFFLLTGNVFAVLALVLIVTPLARVRLGGANARPDFSYTGWFAMLFAAGMGIGLVFFGVSEPISHFQSSVGGTSIVYEGTSIEAHAPAGGALPENTVRQDWAPLGAAYNDNDKAQRLGMAATIFHWGIHPWAIYAIVALALALFSYNKGLPLTMRSIFYPVLGERVWGWPGHIVDIAAVFATLFGLATSLGLGAKQAGAGLHAVFGIPNNEATLVFLILGITLFALGSVVLGVDKGVQRLSQLNMGLAGLLLLFVIVVGPTVAIVSGFFGNLWSYAAHLPALSMPFGREDNNFTQGWTSFYWAWWISWSPFVGMFIARVSRGRTVREFLVAVLLVPTVISVLWMTAFGGTAIDQFVNQGITAVSDAGVDLRLFKMLEGLPWSAVTSFIGVTLVIVFFVTSSDSGSLVIDSITAGGKVDAPIPQRVFWAIIEGAIAIALLVGGGLEALQAMAVSTGLPFAVVLLVGCYAIVKGLMSEPKSS